MMGSFRELVYGHALLVHPTSTDGTRNYVCRASSFHASAKSKFKPSLRKRAATYKEH